GRPLRVGRCLRVRRRGNEPLQETDDSPHRSSHCLQLPDGVVVDQEFLSCEATIDQACERTEDRRVLRINDARPLPQEKEERLQKERDVADWSKIPGTVKDGYAD